MTETRRVLYRCRTPTNFLCPCGAVERKLSKLGLEHEARRVALRRRDRPEIVELTGLPYAPVLVDGDEVVNDSRRIRQYLDWAYGDEAEGAGAGAVDETGAGIPGSGNAPSTMGGDE